MVRGGGDGGGEGGRQDRPVVDGVGGGYGPVSRSGCKCR